MYIYLLIQEEESIHKFSKLPCYIV